MLDYAQLGVIVVLSMSRFHLTDSDNWLRAARKRLRMTVTDLAGHLGVSAFTVSAWERGAWAPDISRATDIAGAVNLRFEDVLKQIAQAKRPRRAA